MLQFESPASGLAFRVKSLHIDPVPRLSGIPAVNFYRLDNCIYNTLKFFRPKPIIKLFVDFSTASTFNAFWDMLQLKKIKLIQTLATTGYVNCTWRVIPD